MHLLNKKDVPHEQISVQHYSSLSTSYDGIIRIRLKGSEILPSQP